MKRTTALRPASALAAAGLVFILPVALSAQYVAPQEPGPAPAKWAQLEKDVETGLRDFQGVLGYVIKDLESGRTLTRLPDRRFPSASMVKVPIMAACYRAAEDGRISLHDTLKLKRSDKVRGSGVLRGAAIGAPVTVEKLLELMITNSDNTA